MKKLIKILGAMMIVTMMAVACAPAATPAPTTAPTVPTPTTAPTVVVPTAEPTMPAPTATTAPTMAPIDCMGAQSGDTMTIVYQWSGVEESDFNTLIKPFRDACGISITAQSTRDDAVLDTMVKSTPPDVLIWPNLSPLKLYASKLLPLDMVGVNTANYPSYWADMGTVGGNLVALPFKADVKSIIWYSPAEFQAFGYTVPTTMDELNTLVEKMVADGNIPWSMGEGAGAATGWAGSDFIQDLLLASQGPAFVNGIIAGTVAYNDPAVLAAYQIYQKWASDEKYTIGGANGTLNTTVDDAILKVFSNPPEAMMIKISGFAGGNIAKAYPTLTFGTDYDFFQFPEVKGLQGSADFMYAFSDKPAAKALLAYLSSEAGAVSLAQLNWGLVPNQYGAGQYTNTQMLKLGEMLASASGFTFDMGDAIGAPFNTAEWTAIVNVVQGQDIQTNLDAVAAAQQQAIK